MTYPNEPGWRNGPNAQTSFEAAMSAAVKAPALKHIIRAEIAAAPATPEELMARLAKVGHQPLLNTIRARCTDLHKQGVLLPSGTFGIGESKKVRVIRWRLASPEELALHAARKAAESAHGENSNG